MSVIVRQYHSVLDPEQYQLTYHLHQTSLYLIWIVTKQLRSRLSALVSIILCWIQINTSHRTTFIERTTSSCQPDPIKAIPSRVSNLSFIYNHWYHSVIDSLYDTSTTKMINILISSLSFVFTCEYHSMIDPEQYRLSYIFIKMCRV